ncbi:MAG: ABC transporter permease [Clostridia bacterium]|nr:ABC transporter permease [Clostridia bacterium]
MIKGLTRRLMEYGLALLFLGLLWHLAAVTVNKPILPTPWLALEKFAAMWEESLWQHFLVSSWRVLASLIISMGAAVPLGLLLGRSEKADRLLAPLVYLLYPIPKSVFLPLIIVFLGLGDAPKIFLITLILFFQILVAARDAAKGVPQQSLYSMQSLGANQWQTYRHVIWPSCLPKILTSLRISIGTAIAVLFLAESFASEKGLGYLIMSAWGRQEPGEMFAAIMGMALLGFWAYILVDLLEKVWCRWEKL